MDFLKKEVAPLTVQQWEELEKEARQVLTMKLSARRVVDVEGPKGWELHSVGLGRLGSTKEKDGVAYGLRQSLPLVELRVPFTLNLWNLDNITRGDRAPDLDALDNAAVALAKFEDEAVYCGLTEAYIRGLLTEPESEPVAVGCDNIAFCLPEALGRAMETLRENLVEGPYVLVCSTDLWKLIVADNGHESGGYRLPLRRHIEETMGIKIVRSPQVDVNALLSLRGGDFVLTLGQDASLGYESHGTTDVRLYLTETFTFKVNGPQAVVPLQLSKPADSKKKVVSKKK